MQIFIKPISGGTITIEIEDRSDITIGELKQKIYETERIPLKEQRLIIAGVELKDNLRIQSDLHLNTITTMHLVLKPKDAPSPAQQPVSIQNDNNATVPKQQHAQSPAATTMTSSETGSGQQQVIMKLRGDLKLLMDNVLAQAKSDGEKYKLLLEMAKGINGKDLKTTAELKQAARNFFYLVLQRSKFGKGETTSGKHMRDLLGQAGFQGLRNCLLGNKQGDVQYSDLINFASGTRDEKLFSSSNRENTFTFFRGGALHSNKEIKEHVITTLKK